MRATDMTRGKPARLIMAFALPMMAGNICQQLYTIVDAAFVGRFAGIDALAAVGAAATGLALAGGDIIGILLKAYSVYVPGVVCPLAVAIVSGRVRRTRTWLAGVAAGGACGLAGACGAGGDWLPVAGMGISLVLALAAVGRGRE